MCQPPDGLRVPVLVRPGEVDDDVLEETDIVNAVRGLQGGKARGAYGVRSEELNRWL